ncbi:MAG: ABC transporter ATP-binding protein, partial [Candidatus Rokubacteria bacterium]|nr:ABC transporter ATP-binding protein [Candidatus Rokubacteria bacterium]
MLEVERLTKSFGGFTAVADVELVVEPGTVHAVIGPNGAGKTTLFNLVTGVLTPSAGRLVFEGQDITGWRADRITARGVARTFQNIRLFREMTAVENVMVGAHCRTSGGFLAAVARLPWRRSRGERETIRRADDLLELVGLAAKRDVAADELTLVEQRRLEIARALAAGPRLLLLDEPAAGMTPTEIQDANRLILRIRD